MSRLIEIRFISVYKHARIVNMHCVGPRKILTNLPPVFTSDFSRVLGDQRRHAAEQNADHRARKHDDEERGDG